MIGHADVIAHATLKTNDLEAKVDAFVRMRHGLSGAREHYEPYLARLRLRPTSPDVPTANCYTTYWSCPHWQMLLRNTHEAI
jgi:hypothetical protein